VTAPAACAEVVALIEVLLRTLTVVAGATAGFVAYDSGTHQVQIDTNHDGTWDMFINIGGDSVATTDYLFHA